VIASGATPEEASWCYIENRQLGTFAGRLRGRPAAAVRLLDSREDWDRCGC